MQELTSSLSAATIIYSNAELLTSPSPFVHVTLKAQSAKKSRSVARAVVCVVCTHHLLTSMDMKDNWERLTRYADANPVKFVAMGSFLSLGAVPLVVFVAYAIATLIASLIGAVVIELFLLAIGITGLAFVLFFVTCLSVCATSVFAAGYFTYKTVLSSFGVKKADMSFLRVWPLSSGAHSDPCSQPQAGEVELESDKKK